MNAKMAMDEQQTLLGSSTGVRSQLSVTIVEMGSSPQPSPMSDRSSQQLISESTATGEPVIEANIQQKDEGRKREKTTKN